VVNIIKTEQKEQVSSRTFDATVCQVGFLLIHYI